MPRNYVLGLNAVIYYLPPANVGTPGDGTYQPTAATNFASDLATLKQNPVCIVQDVTLNLEAAQADTSTRCTKGWRTQVPTLRNGSADTSFLWKPDDSVFETFLACFLANSTIALALLDGAVESGPGSGVSTGDKVQGLYADYTVDNFTRNEGLEEALTADISFSIAPAAQGAAVPQWVVHTVTAPV